MLGKRISRKKLTTKKMIDLYQVRCSQASAESKHYGTLFTYAQRRSGKRVFDKKKSTHRQYPVHCHQSAKHEEMKQTIRWAGPRMLWRHPILAVHHPIDDRRLVLELPEEYRPKKTRG